MAVNHEDAREFLTWLIDKTRSYINSTVRQKKIRAGDRQMRCWNIHLKRPM